MKRRLVFAVAVAAVLGGLTGPSAAQEIVRSDFNKSDINKGKVSIITGGIEYVHNTYMRLAGEMAAVLDKEGELRILPVMGRGPVDNIKDLLYLKGIDVGVVHSDVLTFLRNQKALPSAQRRLRYIAKLYDEYFHVIAHKDIGSIEDLAGKKVVIGTTASSGATISALTAFGILGIEPEYLVDDWKAAVEKIKRGEVAAMVYSTVRGSGFVKDIESEGKLKFLSLPFTDELRETYFQAAFTPADYPNLVPTGQVVETLQFAAIMAVYDWKPGSARYRNVANFTGRLFDNIEELRKPPRHERWQTFDPAAEVRGWARFKPAQDWLDLKEAEERRIAAEEQKRREAETAEKERLAAEAAEKERLAAEAAERERLAAEAAERQKLEAAQAAVQADDLQLSAQFVAFVDYMRGKGGMAQASEEELVVLFRRFMNWKKLEAEKSVN